MTKLDSVFKSRDIIANKGSYSQGYGLPNDHVQFWELDYKEGWASKNWCLWTVVLEKTPASTLGSKEIKPVHLTGNQPWILFGRTDAEAKVPILWPPDVKNWLTGKDPDAGKDWGQKEKGKTEDEMAGWHHQCSGHELGQTLGDSERQGGLACCSPWGRRVGHHWMTEHCVSRSQRKFGRITDSHVQRDGERWFLKSSIIYNAFTPLLDVFWEVK